MKTAKPNAFLSFRDQVTSGSPAAVIEKIREGLPAALLPALGDHLGLTKQQLFGYVGIPPTTADRKIKARARLDAAASERLARIAAVEVEAERVFGAGEQGRAWLKTPNLALRGVEPLALLDTEVGAQEVRKILAAIAYGGVV